MLKLKKEIKDRWVAALRSGDYSQARGALRTPDGDFCCLGVLCDLAIKSGEIAGLRWSPINSGMITDSEESAWRGTLPPAVAAWAFRGGSERTARELMRARDPWVEVAEEKGPPRVHMLSTLNDGLSTTGKEFNFSEIADIVEEQL